MEQRRKASPVRIGTNRSQNPMVVCFNLFNFGLILPYPASYVMNNFFVYYPDTPVPRARLYACVSVSVIGMCEQPPNGGARRARLYRWSR